jgi:hypothetical protein
MNNELTVAASADKFRKYDEICGAALVNLFTLSKNSDTIAFRGFNPKNKEHLFVLGVARGLAGSLGKKVALDVNKFQLWKLNRGIDKDCRLILVDGKEAIYSINPEELLTFMRPGAVSACGENFTFADIYNEYYNRKKGK